MKIRSFLNIKPYLTYYNSFKITDLFLRTLRCGRRFTILCPEIWQHSHSGNGVSIFFETSVTMYETKRRHIQTGSARFYSCHRAYIFPLL